ncbi:MAG: tetratricopeptide repeat protein, partial [Nitrospira sp.]|nr:tetratricopeptide repeat protein [Nitrospira sp.]
SQALGNLGNVCALLEQYDQAEGHYREVLALQRVLQEGHVIGETLGNLGNLKA